MSKTMKWILGIVIAVLVIGLLAGAGFLATRSFYGFNGRAAMMGDLDRRSWDGGRIVPRGDTPWGEMPMRPYNHMTNVPFARFFPFGGLFIGLICLGGLALLIFGIVALVVNLTRPKNQAQPAPVVASPVAESPVPVSEPEGEMSEPGDTVPETIPAKTCPSCARPVNDEWSHCPYCGSALTE